MALSKCQVLKCLHVALTLTLNTVITMLQLCPLFDSLFLTAGLYDCSIFRRKIGHKLAFLGFLTLKVQYFQVFS